MTHEDAFAASLDMQRKPGESDDQLRHRITRFMRRCNRGGSIHDIAATLLDATPNAITAAYKDETTKYVPPWWRRWFLREQPRVEMRALFVIVVQRTSTPTRVAQMKAEAAMVHAIPAGVLGRVEVLEQVGAL